MSLLACVFIVVAGFGLGVAIRTILWVIYWEPDIETQAEYDERATRESCARLRGMRELEETGFCTEVEITLAELRQECGGNPELILDFDREGKIE